MRKAYSYLRFSTPEQAKGDSYRRQMTRAIEYAARENLVLDSNLSFEDLGISAFRGINSESGALKQFKEAVDQGLVLKGSVLLVESLDRISRQTAWKALQVLSDIAEAGVHVATLSDGREYSIENFIKDPMSILMALLIFVRANEESEMKSQRSRASWARKRSIAADVPLTARGPAWLQLADDRSFWKIDEGRAKLVRRIYTLATKGKGEHAITALLNKERMPPWGSPGRPPTPDRIWNASSIAKILRNPAVIGTMIPYEKIYENGSTIKRAGSPIPGYYPRVISDDLWGAVRLLKSSTTPCRGRHINRPLQNVMGGLGECSACQRSMIRVYRKSPDRNNASYLTCNGSRYGMDCQRDRIRLDVIENSLIDSLDLFSERTGRRPEAKSLTQKGQIPVLVG